MQELEVDLREAWNWPSTLQHFRLFPLGNSPSCPHGMQNNIFASMTSAPDPAGNWRLASPSQLPDRVIDLGCGPGNSTAVLAERWPKAELTGLDSSPEMIAAARRADPRLAWRVGDIAAWANENGQTYDIVFSNAALQWVDDHAAVFPKLLTRVAPGGALAIQMPGNFDAPAHRIMRELAASPAWRDRFPTGGVREWHVHDLATYYDILAPIAAAVDIWQTEYLHIMADAAAIVEWYKGTGLRPFLDALANDEQRAEFTRAISSAHSPGLSRPQRWTRDLSLPSIVLDRVSAASIPYLRLAANHFCRTRLPERRHQGRLGPVNSGVERPDDINVRCSPGLYRARRHRVAFVRG